jgi:tetratricopeptide (TPR) repeat protein
MDATLARYPHHPDPLGTAGLFHASRGRYDKAEEVLQRFREEFRGSAHLQAMSTSAFATVQSIQGRLREAEEQWKAGSDLFIEIGLLPNAYWGTLGRASTHLFLRDDPAAAVRILEEALATHPLGTMEPSERPYLPLAGLFAAAGEVGRARDLLEEFEHAMDPRIRKTREDERQWVLGEIALTEGRSGEAIRAARLERSENPGDPLAGTVLMARAYELAGNADSALVAYESYVETPTSWRVFEDAFYLAPSLMRLGELYEARGERERALEYYGRFVELWKDADPELRDRVRQAQSRINVLAAES